MSIEEQAARAEAADKIGDVMLFKATKLAFNMVEWLLVIAALLVIHAKTDSGYALGIAAALSILMSASVYTVLLRWTSIPIWKPTTGLRYWSGLAARVVIAAGVITYGVSIARGLADAVVASGLLP